LPKPDRHEQEGQAIASVARNSGGRSRSVASDIALYSGFAATGVGCALPGALLPTLLIEWHLDDHHAGTLFFLIWVGSSIGALTMQKDLRSSITLGSALTALSAFGLALAAKTLILPLVLVYGLGLGMTMTSISLLRQRSHVPSVELVRLNLMWALGACLCPILMTHALRISSSRQVLLVLAIFFAALSFWVLLFQQPVERLRPETASHKSSWLGIRAIPLSLVIMTMLVTGIEASGGAWLATYAHRMQHGGLAITIGAPTCLWAGLLCSRLLGWLPNAEENLRRWFPGLLLIVAASTAALVADFNSTALLISAFLLGIGLGPLYPILLARVMAFQETGTIFLLAGISSAVMPWLTGTVSAHFASLRAGFTVIAASALTLLLLGLRPNVQSRSAEARLS
jgi:MFS transporter, FHS family, glucose/mannose:H+ symporter